ISDVGLSQLVITSPRAMPTGTRPEAIAPATVPRKKGVTTDDAAKAIPNARWSDSSDTAPRKAKAEPRRITPNATAVSGTYSVDAIAEKTVGNPVQVTTRAKISQTWLASQTGPIDSAMRRRLGTPSAAEPASRSQNPAPKSAPASSTYAVMPPHRNPSTTLASALPLTGWPC